MHLDGKYTKITKSALPIAKKLARGCYQSDLLDGGEAWSGMTLRGKAKEYGGRYKRSRSNFLRRLVDSPDLRVIGDVMDHKRHVLLIVTETEAMRFGGCWETLRAFDTEAEEYRVAAGRNRMQMRIDIALFDPLQFEDSISEVEAKFIADAFAEGP